MLYDFTDGDLLDKQIADHSLHRHGVSPPAPPRKRRSLRVHLQGFHRVCLRSSCKMRRRSGYVTPAACRSAPRKKKQSRRQALSQPKQNAPAGTGARYVVRRNVPQSRPRPRSTVPLARKHRLRHSRKAGRVAQTKSASHPLRQSVAGAATHSAVAAKVHRTAAKRTRASRHCGGIALTPPTAATRKALKRSSAKREAGFRKGVGGN